jgi:hypothetical protein
MVVQRIAGRGEVNYALFDVYSLAHGSIGVIAALVVGLGFWSTLALAVGWELAEHLGKNLVPRLFPFPTQDTLANSVGDVLSTLAGWALARVARRSGADARTG